MSDLTDIDWAYLAGFVDGEGCISASPGRKKGGGPSGRWYARLSISQADQVSLLELYQLFGVGQFFIHKRGSAIGIARWCVSKQEDLEWILEGILPYLRLKHTQAKVALRISKVNFGEKTEARVVRLRALKEHRKVGEL